MSTEVKHDHCRRPGRRQLLDPVCESFQLCAKRCTGCLFIDEGGDIGVLEAVPLLQQSSHDGNVVSTPAQLLARG